MLLQLYYNNTCLLIYSRRCDLTANNESEHSYYNYLEKNIPDYLAGTVLLRSSPRYPQSFTGELRFQTLFNIVVIWMAVFIGLSKGKRLSNTNRNGVNISQGL